MSKYQLLPISPAVYTSFHFSHCNFSISPTVFEVIVVFQAMLAYDIPPWEFLLLRKDAMMLIASLLCVSDLIQHAKHL